MSFFDNIPIMAAFAVAAPEIFGAEAALGGTEAVAAEEIAAQEAAKQEAARLAAEEAARQEAARQAAAQQGILQAGDAAVISPQQQAYMDASQASVNNGITQGVKPMQPPATSGLPLSANTGFGAPVEPININTPGMGQTVPTVTNEAGLVQPAATPSALEAGWDKFSTFANKHPYLAAGAGYVGAYNLGLLDPRQANFNQDKYSGPLSNYRLSPNFQGRTANPRDFQYTPRYAEGGIMLNEVPSGPVDVPHGETGGEVGFASGGIASYSKGGNLSSTLDYYTNMMDGHNDNANMPSPARGPMAGGMSHDPGIYYDLDPDTRYQDALTAAQIRQAKVNKRANMQLPGMQRPTPMGQLNLRPPGSKAEASGSTLDPENAAQGGIMQAGGHLGGYAAGGNPRLLKGPGDGMSDDIPATIANKQPARLADGEFVVPADVVSHLGNGSTDAGAKKLHQMMTKVRKERTGNPKQGKQINPNKFMPK